MIRCFCKRWNQLYCRKELHLRATAQGGGTKACRVVANGDFGLILLPFITYCTFVNLVIVKTMELLLTQIKIAFRRYRTPDHIVHCSQLFGKC